MLVKSFLLGTAIAAASTALVHSSPSPLDKRGFSLICISVKCGGSMASCISDRSCNAGISCLRSCSGTEDEIAVCHLACSEKANNQKLDSFTRCVVDKCTTQTRQQCSPPKNQLQDPAADVNELMRGRWYVVSGMSGGQDCYPQTYDFDTNGANAEGRVKYSVTFEPEQGVRGVVNGAAQLFKDEHRLLASFGSHGFEGTKDMHLISLSADKQFALYYYCGITNPGSTWMGAVVISRNPSLNIPEDVKKQFDAAYKAAEIPALPKQFSEFCAP
ncbi:Violaxanthin de-epoxidase, chloroplastic, partial [Quaeritorhiza haematococci]